MMRPMRAGMYFNIAQYQEDGVEVPTFYGPPVPIDLSQLRDTNLSTVIGQGLMAIDRQYVMQLVQQIVFALIQNPRAAEQVDILGLLDYWVAMMDVERSEEHTSELQSLMRISYAVFCLTKKKHNKSYSCRHMSKDTLHD